MPTHEDVIKALTMLRDYCKNVSSCNNCVMREATNCDSEGMWSPLDFNLDISQEQTNEIKIEYKPIQTQMEGIPQEQTNEEWLHSLNTEQLAVELGNIVNNAYFCAINGKTNTCYNRTNCTGYCQYGWKKWLKAVHKE